MDWSDRIGRRLKLRDLHILMAVADTGSMAKAAARLRISHPAVSKAISETEGTLAVRLSFRATCPIITVRNLYASVDRRRMH